jgi:hypothetical protein
MHILLSWHAVSDFDALMDSASVQKHAEALELKFQ